MRHVQGYNELPPSFPILSNMLSLPQVNFILASSPVTTNEMNHIVVQSSMNTSMYLKCEFLASDMQSSKIIYRTEKMCSVNQLDWQLVVFGGRYGTFWTDIFIEA